jgi:hypothetical protein
MATRHRRATPSQLNAEATTERSSGTRVGVGRRWRAYRAERKRRALVQRLRRAADRALETDQISVHPEALLRYRAAAVRADLLEIAAMLERAQTPTPACFAALDELLSADRDSPLYNPRIPVAELHTTLDEIRSGL